MKLHLVLFYYVRTLYVQRRFRQCDAHERHAEKQIGLENSGQQGKQSIRSRLADWQEKRIIRHVDRVRQASLFYRKLWEGVASENWRSFPVIDKEMMMNHFDELNTVGLSRDQAMDAALQAEQTRDFKPMVNGVTVGLSSGTSGNRGLFIVSEREQAAWSGTVLAKMLPGGLLQHEKIAFFLRANSNLYESVKRGRLQFKYFDLLDPLERLVQQMESYRPGIWIAPASMLRLLAEAYVSGSLTARPRKLISVAEVLDPLDRCYIEGAFGQIVHQAYQCTEGFLGATCVHGTIHLNEDIVYIEKEYIGLNTRRFVPIITDFSRSSQPIVRYRLNDILTEASAPCPCGSVFTAIERIEGRCDDMIYLPHMEHGEPVAVFPDFITRAVIAVSADIKHYRVVQTGPHHLEISYQRGHQEARGDVLLEERTKAPITEQIKSQIAALCDRIDCVMPELRFVPYEHTPGAVKLRRVERRWQP